MKLIYQLGPSLPDQSGACSGTSERRGSAHAGGFRSQSGLEPASPRNTMMARFRRIMSSSPRMPTWAPSLDFGMVVSLSTIKRYGVFRPLRSVGLTSRRKSGAAVGSEVKAQTVKDSVASNSPQRTKSGTGLRVSCPGAPKTSFRSSSLRFNSSPTLGPISLFINVLRLIPHRISIDTSARKHPRV